tara:strand:+ start:928 stop:1569 length:642 start_codon:yes stop_codon:yes gene_type:complete
MKRPKPSLFAIISLLVLLALGVAANLYIAHQHPNPPVAILPFGPTGPLKPFHTPPSNVERWPTVPEQIQRSFGPPSQLQRFNETPHCWYLIQWYEFEEDPDWWARLVELRSGFPLAARSMMEAESGGANYQDWIWPLTEGQYLAPAITYHPLGLILNPLIYALPPWIVLLLLRHTLIRHKQRRRTNKGLCPHCAYDLSATQHLPTCPECGHTP